MSNPSHRDNDSFADRFHIDMMLDLAMLDAEADAIREDKQEPSDES